MFKRLLLYYDALRSVILDWCRKTIFKRFSISASYSKVLVVRKGTIGDHTVCQPIYLALRSHFKNAQLHLLTSNGGNAYAHISKLPEMDFFDAAINADDMGRKELIKSIKKANYNLVIELPQDLDTLYTQVRNMFVYRYCGIKTGVGWAAGISLLFKSYRFKNIELIREFEKHKQSLAHQGFTESIKEVYLKAEPVELLKGASLENTIVMAPGAKLACKRWKKYKALASELVNKNFKIALIGGVGEGFEGAHITNYCGKLDLIQSRYLISQCELVICNDSGPMHLAYSVGTPLIALFGARSYPKAWWPPVNQKFKIIQQLQNYPLAYITHKKWEQKEDLHLSSISVDQVVDCVVNRG